MCSLTYTTEIQAEDHPECPECCSSRPVLEARGRHRLDNDTQLSWLGVPLQQEHYSSCGFRGPTSVRCCHYSHAKNRIATAFR